MYSILGWTPRHASFPQKPVVNGVHILQYQHRRIVQGLVAIDAIENTDKILIFFFIFQEELVLVKRKVERLRKIEMASDMDEILKEEIREYKETLTCPSCKVKRKDAVLTKCFHCFCYDCLRTRYETRQRKCPKCNAAFGASDYHRLYLA